MEAEKRSGGVMTVSTLSSDHLTSALSEAKLGDGSEFLQRHDLALDAVR